MKPTRRGFLAILGAVLGGSALPASVLANPVYDKYTKVIKLQQNILDVTNSFAGQKLVYQKYKNIPWKVSHITIAISPSIDELFDFLFANFDGEQTPEAYAQTRSIFVNTYDNKGNIVIPKLNVNTLDVNELKQVLDVVIPIIIVKNLITVYRVPIDSQLNDGFGIFTGKYRNMIMAT
jgi:hypothetical protein